MMGHSVSKKYQTVIAIMQVFRFLLLIQNANGLSDSLESGFLYPLFAMLHIALTETSDLVYVPVNFMPTVVQMGVRNPLLDRVLHNN